MEATPYGWRDSFERFSHVWHDFDVYGVGNDSWATIKRRPKNIGLFCKRALQKRPIFCKRDLHFYHMAWAWMIRMWQRHEWFVCVARLIHICGIAHACVAWLIRMWHGHEWFVCGKGMNDSYVWHDWFIYICVITHAYVIYIVLQIVRDSPITCVCVCGGWVLSRWVRVCARACIYVCVCVYPCTYMYKYTHVCVASSATHA